MHCVSRVEIECVTDYIDFFVDNNIRTAAQAPAGQFKKCVVRDEEDHRLQVGGQDRWKSGQSQ